MQAGRVCNVLKRSPKASLVCMLRRNLIMKVAEVGRCIGGLQPELPQFGRDINDGFAGIKMPPCIVKNVFLALRS